MKRPHYDLIIAWANGAEIEYFDEYEKVWIDCERPSFFEGTKYRIKKTKPTINWDHVASTFNWLAVDDNDKAYLYENKPALVAKEYWNDSSGISIHAEHFASFKRGNCDWRESLVKRPEGGKK